MRRSHRLHLRSRYGFRLLAMTTGLMLYILVNPKRRISWNLLRRAMSTSFLTKTWLLWSILKVLPSAFLCLTCSCKPSRMALNCLMNVNSIHQGLHLFHQGLPKRNQEYLQWFYSQLSDLYLLIHWNETGLQQSFHRVCNTIANNSQDSMERNVTPFIEDSIKEKSLSTNPAISNIKPKLSWFTVSWTIRSGHLPKC